MAESLDLRVKIFVIMRKSEFQSLKKTLESNKRQTNTYLDLCKKLEGYQKNALKTFSELISVLGSSCEKSSTALIEIFTHEIRSASSSHKHLSKWSSLFQSDLQSIETCFERLKFEESLWQSYDSRVSNSKKQSAFQEASEMITHEHNRLTLHIQNFVSSYSSLHHAFCKSSSIQDSTLTSSQKTQKPSFCKPLASSPSFNTHRKSVHTSHSSSPYTGHSSLQSKKTFELSSNFL